MELSRSCDLCLVVLCVFGTFLSVRSSKLNSERLFFLFSNLQLKPCLIKSDGADCKIRKTFSPSENSLVATAGWEYSAGWHRAGWHRAGWHIHIISTLFISPSLLLAIHAYFIYSKVQLSKKKKKLNCLHQPVMAAPVFHTHGVIPDLSDCDLGRCVLI